MRDRHSAFLNPRFHLAYKVIVGHFCGNLLSISRPSQRNHSIPTFLASHGRRISQIRCFLNWLSQIPRVSNESERADVYAEIPWQIPPLPESLAKGSFHSMISEFRAFRSTPIFPNSEHFRLRGIGHSNPRVESCFQVISYKRTKEPSFHCSPRRIFQSK